MDWVVALAAEERRARDKGMRRMQLMMILFISSAPVSMYVNWTHSLRPASRPTILFVFMRGDIMKSDVSLGLRKGEGEYING
jgi:hypothetical protein